MNHPKPTALKLLEGNLGKRPLNENEPKPKRIIPSCPKHLDIGAKRHWKKISKYLFDLGLLTEIDGDALAVYCQLYSDWVRLENEIRDDKAEIILKNGSEINSITESSSSEDRKISTFPDIQLKHTIDAAGNEFIERKVNPRVIMKRETLKLMLNYLREFGMTSSSRSRIGIQPIQGKKTGIKKYLT